VRFKKQALGHFLKWFGDVPIETVSAAMAEDYRTMLVKEGRSKRTANGYLANFRPFFNWLRRHGRIDANPFDAVRAYRITEQAKETFTSSELGRLLRVSDELWQIRICMGLLGCRRGEMLNIVVGDIHLDADVPHIVLSPKSPGPDTWGWELKDHAIRYVAVPDVMDFDGIGIRLRDLIRRQMNDIPRSQPYVLLEPRHCKRNIGKEWVPDPTWNFQRMFRRIQAKAQIEPPRRYHELRAAFATTMISKVGLSRAADALGHSTTQITRKYDRHSEMSLLAEINDAIREGYKKT